MINKHLNYLFCLIVLTSCQHNINVISGVSDSALARWRADSAGCLGNRYHLVKIKAINQKTFIGFNYKNIQKQIGQSNSKRLKGHDTVFYYYITCKFAPVPKFTAAPIAKVVNSEASIFILNVNSNDVITNAEIITP